jgi:hypothetical protein
VELLTKNQDKLRRLSELLVTKETVDGADVYSIAGVPEPKGIESGSTLAPERAAAASAVPKP